MRARIVTIVVLAAAACPAFPANVIREWGGHSPSDYDIRQVGGQHVGVVILRNTQPTLPWKFEAYDSVTGAPGDIDYIIIDSGSTVGNITLSVIGGPGHTYGARDLELLNLVDYGASTNVIDEIDITGDACADGDIEAYGADSVTIGAEFGPYDLHIFGPVTGDVTISGSGPHRGDIFVGGTSYAGDMYFAGDMDGDIDFGGSANGNIDVNGDLAGMITVAGDADDAWSLRVHNITEDGGVDIAGDLHGRVSHYFYSGQIRGIVHVGGSVSSGGDLECRDLTRNSKIEIDGDADGSIDIFNYADGTIEIGGQMGGGLWANEFRGTGTVTVAGDVSGWVSSLSDFSASMEFGSLSGDIWLPYPGDARYPMTGSLTVNGDVSGEIAVGQLEGDISIAGDLTGPIYIGTEAGGDLDGTIEIAGTLADSINVVNQLDGTIHALGNVTGSIQVSGDMHGAITIGTDAASPANLTGTIDLGSHMKGVIRVTGDVVGDIEIAGDVEDPLGDLTAGHIIVDGTFVDEANIIIVGEFAGDTEYIAIDYDGFDLADSWESGAQVWIDSVSYGGNTPAEHLWEITCQKGDMTNDGVVNMFDIDPFVMVINDELEDYEEDYPGLLGSVNFHADMNCDGDVDYFDVDAFSLRLLDPEEYCEEYYDPETCYDCDCAAEESLGGGGGGASELAAAFLEYVDAERLPVIVDAAEELASYHADTPRGDFWAAVVEALKA